MISPVARFNFERVFLLLHRPFLVPDVGEEVETREVGEVEVGEGEVEKVQEDIRYCLLPPLAGSAWSTRIRGFDGFTPWARPIGACSSEVRGTLS